MTWVVPVLHFSFKINFCIYYYYSVVLCLSLLLQMKIVLQCVLRDEIEPDDVR